MLCPWHHRSAVIVVTEVLCWVSLGKCTNYGDGHLHQILVERRPSMQHHLRTVYTHRASRRSSIFVCSKGSMCHHHPWRMEGADRTPDDASIGVSKDSKPATTQAPSSIDTILSAAAATSHPSTFTCSSECRTVFSHFSIHICCCCFFICFVLQRNQESHLPLTIHNALTQVHPLPIHLSLFFLV